MAYRPIFIGRARDYVDPAKEIEIEVFEDGRMILRQIYKGAITTIQIWERVDREKKMNE